MAVFILGGRVKLAPEVCGQSGCQLTASGSDVRPAPQMLQAVGLGNASINLIAVAHQRGPTLDLRTALGHGFPRAQGHSGTGRSPRHGSRGNSSPSARPGTLRTWMTASRRVSRSATSAAKASGGGDVGALPDWTSRLDRSSPRVQVFAFGMRPHRPQVDTGQQPVQLLDAQGDDVGLVRPDEPVGRC